MITDTDIMITDTDIMITIISATTNAVDTHKLISSLQASGQFHYRYDEKYKCTSYTYTAIFITMISTTKNRT